MEKILIKLLPYFLCAALATGASLLAASNHYGAVISDMKSAQADKDKLAAEAQSAALKNAADKLQAVQGELAGMAKKNQEELQNAKLENERLNDLFERGDLGVSVATKARNCPNVPNSTAPRSVGDAENAELTTNAGRSYLRARENIQRTEKALSACQEYVTVILQSLREQNGPIAPSPAASR